MVYFCRTYTSLVPFLKGLHLTLDSWRGGRDDDSWKLKLSKIEQRLLVEGETSDTTAFDEDEENEWEDSVGYLSTSAREPLDPLLLCQLSDEDIVGTLEKPKLPPSQVSHVPRLKADVSALQMFLKTEKAPWRFVRGK